MHCGPSSHSPGVEDKKGETSRFCPFLLACWLLYAFDSLSVRQVGSNVKSLGTLKKWVESLKTNTYTLYLCARGRDSYFLHLGVACRRYCDVALSVFLEQRLGGLTHTGELMDDQINNKIQGQLSLWQCLVCFQE